MRRRWPFWLLLAGWLAAQTLGLLHREVHGAQAGAAVHAAGEGDPFHGGTAAADCSLYDHAGLADTLPFLAAPLLPALPPGGVAASPPLQPQPPPPPPFHARGPPALH